MNLSEIKDYIFLIQKEELKFKQSTSTCETILPKKTTFLVNLVLKLDLLIVSIVDIFTLIFFSLFKDFKNKNIVFTAKNFCTIKNGVLEDRVVKPLNLKNILFINSSKEYKIKKINDKKVYNIGGMVNIVKLFLKKEEEIIKIYISHKIVNEFILLFFPKNISVFILWFYDINSLSIIFSKYRNKILLSEVQHGSIINYPPYEIISPVKIADVFYVKNTNTITYLKNNLNKNFKCKYSLLSYPNAIKRSNKKGIHILYASTIEFNGLHPLFKSFLEYVNSNKEIFIKIRLHPREKHKVNFFKQELDCLYTSYEFDTSANWLERILMPTL